MNSSVAFNSHDVVQPAPLFSSRAASSPWKETHTLQHHPRSSLPEPLATASCDLSLSSLCDWSRTLSVLSGLASFAWNNVSEVHPRRSMCQCFTPFYIWIISDGMDGPLSAHPSSVDEQLSRLHLLAFADGAAARIHVLVFVCTSAFSSFGHVPRHGIAELYSNSMFNFLRKQQIVFHGAAGFYLPANYVRELQFLHIITDPCYFPLFW